MPAHDLDRAQPGEDDFRATRAQVHAMAARLPRLEGAAAEIRLYFLLFYLLVDDLCLPPAKSGPNVDLVRFEEIRHNVLKVLASGGPLQETNAAGTIFEHFWNAAVDTVPAGEHDHLNAVMSDLIDSMCSKYHCIATGIALPLEKFLKLRRRIPAIAYLELERCLRGIEAPTGDDGPWWHLLTESVADCLSWTNDLHSASKEQGERFNLVLQLSGSVEHGTAQAEHEVRRRISARHAEYLAASREWRHTSDEPVGQMLTVYDELLASVPTIYARSARYRPAGR